MTQENKDKINASPKELPKQNASVLNEKGKKKKCLLIGICLLFIIILMTIGGLAFFWMIQKIQTKQDKTKEQYYQLEEKFQNIEKKSNETEDKLKKLEEQNNNQALKKENQDTQKSNESNESGKEKTDACNFSEEINLKKSTNYDIFGGDEFDTVVCGYITTKKETSMETEKEQTNAYFVITKYLNEDFKESIKKGIDEGNSVNKKIGDNYAFNLGCLENGKITGIEYNPDESYIGDEIQNKIITSTKDNPVSLILSFTKHEGFGCNCCNLASKIKLY